MAEETESTVENPTTTEPVAETPVFSSASILDSVKKDLGIEVQYTHFAPDVIMGINSAFSILTQLGVGPSSGFSIEDRTALWTDFIPDDNHLEFVKSYVSKKTKQLFDPPQTGPLASALDQVLKELEWRINVAVETKNGGTNNGI
jgi:hypothetical protein